MKIQDISFVVQGYFDQFSTIKCINSLRLFFPQSEIILTTWQGSDTTCIDHLCDHVIYSLDPGGFIGRYGYVNNLLRQLVSTQAGLKKVTRPYCMKLRSDLVFQSKKFLSYYQKFPKREEKYIFFKNRVIVTSFFSKKYITDGTVILPVPYHISDWLAFGLTEDIKLLWDIPLPQEPEFSQYWFANTYHGIAPDLYDQGHRYPPEQYIFMEALKKKYPNMEFPKTYLDFTDFDCGFYERIVANNMIILDPWQIKIYCNKNKPEPYRTLCLNPFAAARYPIYPGLYDYSEFCRDYKKFCDPNFKVPVSSIFYDLCKKNGGIQW